MIKLIVGSILDSKCDLLILPCNSMGEISPVLQKELYTHNLPYITKEMCPGDINFITSANGFPSASAIGFAASVDYGCNESKVIYLKVIAQQIKYFCEQNSLIKVNMPLLGTGAGKISPVDSYKVFFEEFNDSAEILLCVYCLTATVAREIETSDSMHPTESLTIKNPRVFISYAQMSTANKNWVKAFATRLRNHGVDARLDIFHLRPGQDLPQWMTNEIILADKVLLICDQYYAEKSDARKGGIGWESMIIQGDMLSHQVQEKYIAIIKEEGIDKSLPIYVRSKFAIDWSPYADGNIPENAFNELLINLFDCNLEPPLGPIPDFILENQSRIDIQHSS